MTKLFKENTDIYKTTGHNKRICGEISQLKGLQKYIQSKNVEKSAVDSIKDIRLLEFISIVDFNARAYNDSEEIKAEIKDLDKYLQEIEGGLAYTNENILNIGTRSNIFFGISKIDTPRRLIDAWKNDPQERISFRSIIYARKIRKFHWLYRNKVLLKKHMQILREKIMIKRKFEKWIKKKMVEEEINYFEYSEFNKFIEIGKEGFEIDENVIKNFVKELNYFVSWNNKR
ncbi:kinase-like domain-containing protein [Rhizophagus clarus]|uniref:Kinase-like domain-containing protein n=1 Tax=Rhizophagus clarus TaxID=94130 RepID=A0A8H3QJZ8_9GLOM|nr:kinase-like domain-containing protein [Rhizophagus clarus]